MARDLNLPKEIDGEKVIAHGQAAYDAGSISRSSWKMGFLYLTATRLVFVQGQNRLFEIPLDCLGSLQAVDRNWVPGKSVQQIQLIEESDGQKSLIFLSAKDPQEWIKSIEMVKAP
ncbi:MAG: hypothetical protein P9M10_07390 [Candidatus Euphemobacter frigidus]|nr:hypothetical protein [Candidatus Euphemobacter frigidus]